MMSLDGPKGGDKDKRVRCVGIVLCGVGVSLVGAVGVCTVEVITGFTSITNPLYAIEFVFLYLVMAVPFALVSGLISATFAVVACSLWNGRSEEFLPSVVFLAMLIGELPGYFAVLLIFAQGGPLPWLLAGAALLVACAGFFFELIRQGRRRRRLKMLEIP